MALYLAQIQRKLLQRRIELHLFAVQFKRDELWSKLAATEVVAVKSEETSIGDDTLVIANLSANKQVINIVDATKELPLILHNLSLRLFKYIARESEIKKWKQSLEYQSSVLSDRATELAIRKEKLDEREQTIQLQETSLTKENALLKDALSKLEGDRKAFATAWEHLRLEQKRLVE